MQYKYLIVWNRLEREGITRVKMFIVITTGIDTISCHYNMSLTEVSPNVFLTRYVPCTAKTKCRKYETNIPRKGISGSQSQFPHSRVCEQITYVFPRWVCLFCWRKYVDRSWKYINPSQTHECGNWARGRAIPRKGTYKRNCRCSVDKVFLGQSVPDRGVPILDRKNRRRMG